MKEKILFIESLKGEEIVKDFIVKTIKDFKICQYTLEETEETLIDCCPEKYHEFIKKQCKSLY